MKNLSFLTIANLAELVEFNCSEVTDISRNLSRHYYHSEKEKKGKKRTFCVPSGAFRIIQRKLNRNLLQKIELPNVIKGGVAGYSPQKNADLHTRQEVVVATDIKDYFPSISSGRVKKMFVGLGCNAAAADVLMNLTTCNGRVPLGFPTSVTIANLIACSMARRFIGLCRKHGFNCSIWVDDIVFSGNAKLVNFVELIKKIIHQEGFRVKDEKTKVMMRSERQVVTKMTVNHKVNVSKSKKREIRSLIYRCIKYGPQTQTQLELDVFKRSLAGRIAHIAGINKNTGDMLQRNFNRIAWGK